MSPFGLCITQCGKASEARMFVAAEVNAERHEW